jgi:ketosteroid isomerase-like protein
VKTKVSWCLLGLILVTGLAWSQAGKGGSEQGPADMERKWLESQKTNNPDLIAPYLSDKMTIMNADGKMSDKAGYIKSAKARKYSSVDYPGEIKVTLHGDTAIVTGGYKAKGTYEGKPFDDNERWTDTWMKTGGKWQCIASASTPVKM